MQIVTAHRLAMSASFLLVFLMVSSVPAQAVPYGVVGFIKTVKPLMHADAVWADPASHAVYVADSTNGIHVINATTDTLVTSITGINPFGVVIAPDLNQIWVGASNHTVVVLDASKYTVLARIDVGGTGRSAKIAYDQKNHIVIVNDDQHDPPFSAFINATNFRILGTYRYAAAGGLEQLLWNPYNNLVYSNVPSTTSNPGGEIDVLDPLAQKLVLVFPLNNCNPVGSALAKNGAMLLGCGSLSNLLIINSTTGKTLAVLPTIGGSGGVWYNPTENYFYAPVRNYPGVPMVNGTVLPSSSGVKALAVIDASTYNLVSWLPLGIGWNTLAVDPGNNHIYVPMGPPYSGVMVLGDLTTELNFTNNRISYILNQLEDISSRLSTVAGQASSTSTQASSLGSQISTLNNQISSLNAQISTVTNIAYAAAAVAVVLAIIAIGLTLRKPKTGAASKP